jgi:HD-like signal output (HDOD) protein
MKRILFVDDEPLVLEGLQNVLRRQRSSWEMVFVGSGEAALAELAARPFDVIVTDMRMPRMDGGELLLRVQDRHPRTVRIVLSGQTEHDAARRLVNTAHQFLSKPCEGPLLKEVIERSCRVQDLLEDEGLRTSIGQLGQLPVMPAAVRRLMDALADPHSTMRDVAAIVERDPALAAKVLQLVNSAFFGLARRVTAIDTAVSYLGTDILQGLAVMAEVFQDAEHGGIAGLDVEAEAEHALLTGRIASDIGADTPAGQDAFVAGMLHDVGLIVLAARSPEWLSGVLDEAQRTSRPVFELEAELLGVTHAEIGAYLLGLWGIPLPVVEAVAFHHRPARAESSLLVDIVHIADGLADELGRAHRGTPQTVLDMDYLAKRGLAPRLDEWRTRAATLGSAGAEA